MREERKVFILRIIRDIFLVLALTFVCYSMSLGELHIFSLYHIEGVKIKDIEEAFGRAFTQMTFLSLTFFSLAISSLFQFSSASRASLFIGKTLPKWEKFFFLSAILLFSIGCISSYLSLSISNLMAEVIERLISRGLIRNPLTLYFILRPRVLFLFFIESFLFIAFVRYLKLLKALKAGYSIYEAYIYGDFLGKNPEKGLDKESK